MPRRQRRALAPVLLVLAIASLLLSATAPARAADAPAATGAPWVDASGTLIVHRARIAVHAADPPGPGDVRTPPVLEDGGLHEVALPHRIRGLDNRSLTWIRVRVALPGRRDLTDDPALLAARLTEGGFVSLNGVDIRLVHASNASTQVRWRRPLLVELPGDLLRDDANLLQLDLLARDDTVTVPQLRVGPSTLLGDEFDRRVAIDRNGAIFSSVAALVVGVFMLSIWWFRRRETWHLLLALSCLCWSLRTLAYSVEVVPLQWWWPWRAFYFGALGAGTLTLVGFFLSYARLRQLRWYLLILAYALIGPLALLLSDGRAHGWVTLWWQGGLFPIMFAALVRFTVWGVRKRSVEAAFIMGGVLFAALLSAHDFAVVAGWLPPTDVYTLHLGLPVLLIACGAVLTVRFVRALRSVERANLDLAERLAEKERELAAHYGRLREIERREAGAAERQRIMQDMHDGLGSQLMTSLTLVERGALDNRGMAQVLREAIDDMRLAIDTLAPGREGIAEALGNLAYRLEPRFRAAGVALSFELAELPDGLDVPPADALQLLRIVQETLTNALKHARCTQVVVQARVDGDPPALRLRIADDGAGFDPAAVRRGRGLDGMRRRAVRIGARIEVGTWGDGATGAAPTGDGSTDAAANAAAASGHVAASDPASDPAAGGPPRRGTSVTLAWPLPIDPGSANADPAQSAEWPAAGPPTNATASRTDMPGATPAARAAPFV